MKKYKIASLIPVRGGSKRVPRKNIKIMAGKPMMSWTIEASQNSKYIDRTFISTEDPEIRQIALKAGAEVIDRPKDFCEGEVPVRLAYYHFRSYFLRMGWKYDFDYIVLLLATSPCRTSKNIDDHLEMWFNLKDQTQAVLSVCKTRISSLRTLNKTGNLVMLQDIRQSDVDNRYYGNSAVNVFNENKLVNSGISKEFIHLMNQEDSIDVDTPLDFMIAEMVLKERIKREGVKNT